VLAPAAIFVLHAYEPTARATRRGQEALVIGLTGGAEQPEDAQSEASEKFAALYIVGMMYPVVSA